MQHAHVHAHVHVVHVHVHVDMLWSVHISGIVAQFASFGLAYELWAR